MVVSATYHTGFFESKQFENIAMEFSEIWGQLCRKRPLLNEKTATVEVTSENLEQLLKQVYEQGKNSVPKQEPKPSIFDSIFSTKP